MQSKAETHSPYLSKEVADDEVGQVVSQAAELRGKNDKSTSGLIGGGCPD